MAQGKSEGERGEGMPNETRYARQPFSHNSPITRVEVGVEVLLCFPEYQGDTWRQPDYTGGREYRESRGKLGSPYNRSPSPRFVARDDLSYDVERRTGRPFHTERRLVQNMPSSLLARGFAGRVSRILTTDVEVGDRVSLSKTPKKRSSSSISDMDSPLNAQRSSCFIA